MIARLADSAAWSGSVSAVAASVAAAAAIALALIAYVDLRWRRRQHPADAPVVRQPPRPRRWLLGVVALCIVLTLGAALVYTISGGNGTTHLAVAQTHVPLPHTTPATPTRARLEAAARARRQATEQLSLAHFAQVMFEHPMRCAAVAPLPAHATAQLTCRVGGATVLFTRLGSERASRLFWLERFYNSFPFTGNAGPGCGTGPWDTRSVWYDGAGTWQGSWAVRSSGSDAVLIWEVRHHRVVVRASQEAREVAHVCEIWFAHSGEVP